MFLLGAVLLSAVFFATAALQTSTPYVIQSISTTNVDPEEWIGLAASFEVLSDSCDIPLSTPAERQACVSNMLEYLQLQTSARVELETCAGGTLDLRFTSRTATLLYEGVSAAC